MNHYDKHLYGSQSIIIDAEAPDMGFSPKECMGVEHSEPCTIVIFGATGDLTARKLVPALFNLYINDGMPDSFQIVGCGRTKMSEQKFKDRMKDALDAIHILNHDKWPGFADALSYRSIDYEQLDSFSNLSGFLKDFINLPGATWMTAG